MKKTRLPNVQDQFETCGDSRLGCPSLGEARCPDHTLATPNARLAAAPLNKPPPTPLAAPHFPPASTKHAAHRTEPAQGCRPARTALRRAMPATRPCAE